MSHSSHARRPAPHSLARTLRLSSLAAVWGLLAFPSAARAADGPSPDERTALARLAQAVDGEVVFSNSKRIHKVVIGNPQPIDLGPGRCARFSADGRRLVVMTDRAVFVMNADGSERTQVASDASYGAGCPVEFHPNGQEVLFQRKRQGLFAVSLADRKERKLPVPGNDLAEPTLSADGKRLVVGWRSDLFAVDLEKGTQRKYAKGCSPGVSPDGQWIMRNVGGHHRLRVETWEGDRGFELSAATCLPDRIWDNHHWSNHPNFIAAQGEGDGGFAYVMDVAKNQGTRVTWIPARDPDVFVRRVRGPAGGPQAVAGPASGGAEAAGAIGAVGKGSGAPQAASAPGKTEGWPGSHERLVFVWEDARRPNEVRAGDKVVRTCRAEPVDAARFSRTHGMDLTGGAFLPEEIDEPLRQAVRSSGALTFEAILNVPRGNDRDRPGGKIVSFGEDFSLRDSREDLRFFLRTADAPPHRDGDEVGETVLGSLPSGRATHVIVSYRPGLLVYYADGREVFRSTSLRGGLRELRPGKLVFGSLARDKNPWRGALEAVAIYARFVDAAEAARKMALLTKRLEKLAAPDPGKTVRARGRVVQVAAIPDPDSIAPYRRALVVATYENLDRRALEAPQFQVAHWAILDGRLVGRAARLAPGGEAALTVERLDAHPQLESERLIGDSGDADVPLFVDMGPVDRRDLRSPTGVAEKR